MQQTFGFRTVCPKSIKREKMLNNIGYCYHILQNRGKGEFDLYDILTAEIIIQKEKDILDVEIVHSKGEFIWMYTLISARAICRPLRTLYKLYLEESGKEDTWYRRVQLEMLWRRYHKLHGFEDFQNRDSWIMEHIKQTRAWGFEQSYLILVEEISDKIELSWLKNNFPILWKEFGKTLK